MQGQFRGMRGKAASPRANRSRRFIPTFRAKPRIPQERLIHPPEYEAYKARRKELGL